MDLKSYFFSFYYYAMISVIICSGLAISRLTLLIAYLFLGLSPWSCLPLPAADPRWSFIAAKVPMEVKPFFLLYNPLEFQLQLSFPHVPPACLYPSWVPHNAIQKSPKLIVLQNTAGIRVSDNIEGFLYIIH